MNKTKNLLIYILLCVALLPSFLHAAPTGNIAGRITDALNNKPLEGVAIYLTEGDMGTYSNEKGEYIIKGISVGEHKLNVSYLGYKNKNITIAVESNVTKTYNFKLVKEAIDLESYKVIENRAIPRETPVSFTDIKEQTIKEKYTTGDMPQMLDDIPGLFSTTSGLGEAEITMRGFDAQKIQILVNGIPVNDPESQVVYWSNWTGLSSNVKSVQVQRGAGASLYGSGAFGGSVNIETMGAENQQEITVRTSGGYYSTDGKSATSNGYMKEYDPMNYNFLLKYNSGRIFNDKFKFNLTAERKAGDYYIRGTEYDGWSFGFETEFKCKDPLFTDTQHNINTSFIYAPQKHNQARSTYDPELGKFLGREFNFTNHKWQENKYEKPQFSIRDRWVFSPRANLTTNLFFTTGNGGGSYANNIIFDAESGALLFKPLQTEYTERKNFAKYAYHVYEETGYLVDGFEYDETTTGGTYTWAGDSKTVYSGSNFLDSDAGHSWKMTSYNNHKQAGLNSYFDREITDNVDLILGGEGRFWQARHYKEGTDFRHYNPEDPDSVSTFDAFMHDYDYTTDVINTSGFARTKINIPFDSYIDNINFMLDGQYALYYSKVKENKIKFYDFNKQEFIDEGFYASKNDSVLVWEYYENGDSAQVTVPKFTDDDYDRTYDFFSPKLGVNVNLNKNWNVLANYSIVYKEPKVRDWYDRDNGPGINQLVDNKEYNLEPEKGETIEGGIGYTNDNIKCDLTYYNTKYTGKIENIVDTHGDSKTINAGKATHQGVEFFFDGEFGNFDTRASATFSKNRWGDLNLQNIFYEDAEDVEGKVVPFSPEKMATGEIGYTIQNIPYGNLRLALEAKWNDDYYTTYDNVYCKQLYYYDEEGNFQSIGEHKFVENPEGSGAFDYNEDEDEYVPAYGNGEYDREWILRSSKLPEFFEVNGLLAYRFNLGEYETSIKLNLNNLLNKEDNYSKAYITRAYGMQLKRVDEDGDVSWDDPVFGEAAPDGNDEGLGDYPYLSPSPLFNVFLTVEMKF